MDSKISSRIDVAATGPAAIENGRQRALASTATTLSTPKSAGPTLLPIVPRFTPSSAINNGSAQNTTKMNIQKPVQRKRKASRACGHCQKAHMTCDNNRPCQSCIRKGLQDSCRDGKRKIAKYLRGIEMVDGKLQPIQQPKSEFEGQENCLKTQSTSPVIMQKTAASDSPIQSQHPNMQLLGGSFVPQAYPSPSNSSYSTGSVNFVTNFEDYPQPPEGPKDNAVSPNDSRYEAAGLSHVTSGSDNFDSIAANMEYDFLSSMLSTDLENHRSPLSDQQSVISSGDSYGGMRSNVLPGLSLNEESYRDEVMDFEFSNEHLNEHQDSLDNIGLGLEMLNNSMSLDSGGTRSSVKETNSQSRETRGSSSVKPSGDTTPIRFDRSIKSPEDVYTKVTEPYSYTLGYHKLNRYLKARFDRKDLLMIAEYMASYRPSFIAATKSLKEEDLIFMEKCFQRTLLEYEKYIGYSATPTILWRRTGEIAAVGKEFYMLTGWTRADLFGPTGTSTRFIVELMDNSSTIEYFRMFSELAFGDSRGSTVTECVLLKPDPSTRLHSSTAVSSRRSSLNSQSAIGKIWTNKGSARRQTAESINDVEQKEDKVKLIGSTNTIRTACIWTVKRDMFDIPMMIVGNFLPIW